MGVSSGDLAMRERSSGVGATLRHAAGNYTSCRPPNRHLTAATRAMPTLPSGPLLAVDSGSPLVSVAVGRPELSPIVRESWSSRSSTALMRLVDSCLHESALEPAELGGVLVLSGPGSFTGLRVGMAVAMGLHQALGLAAGTLSTFPALAHQAPVADRPVHAAVRALRTDWYVQRFDRPGGVGATSERVVDDDLLRLTDSQLVGFGLDRLIEDSALQPASPWSQPGPLAASALQLAAAANWDAASLTRPAYLAPPPVHRRASAGSRP